MNWSDERYVKLYVRDTLTWLSLSWEARALLALLLRKVDGAGLLETGTLELGQAVALQLVMPVDVARRALSELISLGTLTEVRGGILIPNFVEAQESTKTEARKKKDQRQRVADQRRLAQLVESTATPVPDCPALSPTVPACPPPAQPTTTTSPPPPPAHHQPSGEQPAKRRTKPKQVELPAEVVTPKPAREPSLVERLVEYFREGRDLKITSTPDLGGLHMVPAPPDDEPNWPRSAATVATWVGLVPPGDDGEQYARMLIDTYLEDPYWAGATHRETKAPQPYPWNALLSEKVWRKYHEQLERELGAAA